MSTPSRSASSRALPSGRTLKPMTIASEAVARLMSFSVMAPTPRWITRSATSSPSSSSILSSASSSASTEPETSPLMIRLSCSTSPASSASSRSSSEIRRRVGASCALRSRACRARRSAGPPGPPSTTRKLSPAPGTEVKPSTCTGRAGPGLLDGARRPRRASPGPGRRRRRRRSSRRRAACRAGPARSPPGRGPGRGAPRWPRPGRPGPGWPAGRARRPRSAGWPRAAPRC